MSEPKKVVLASFQGSKKADKDVEKVTKTFRLVFDLTRTNEDTCPIINYKEELAAAKKKEKLTKNDIEKSSQKDPLPDQEDDDDVRRIANEMEAKYGMCSASKKKRKGRKDDYADIGMGYDESDSFIDNTDGYDEMIPQNVTTLHGGFYINSGALEFKTDEEASSNIYLSTSSDDSTDDEEVTVKKHNTKRLLSESDDGDEEKDKKRPIKSVKLANSQQKMKKNYLSPYKIKPKKKRILPTPPDDPPVHIAEDATAANKQIAADDETDNKLSKDNDNIIDIINSVALGDGAPCTDHVFNNNLLHGCSTALEHANHIRMDIEDSESESACKSAPNNLPNDVAESKDETIKVHEDGLILPENLPSSLFNIINAIKKVAAINIANNTSVFSSQVNNLIISFENKCKCLGKQSLSKVYAYLAAVTKCEKDTFIARVKKLVLQENDAKLKQIIDLLRNKIIEVMPALRDNYENMQSHVEMRKLFNEDIKNLRMPNKTFPWTKIMKKWIRDIYLLKRKYFVSQGVAKETLDAQLEDYFKAEIHILWPDGWTSMHYLIKVAKIDKETEKPSNPPIIVAANSKPTKHAEKDDNNTSNINGNTAASNNTPVPKVNSEVIIKHAGDNEETCTKTTDTLKVNSSTKYSEKSVAMFAVPSVRALPKPNLSQVSITPVNNPSAAAQTHTNSRDGEQVNVKCENEQQQQQKESVNQIKTISEILKMNRAKKEAAAAAAAAVNIRSSSPSLVNSTTTCQIIDLTENSPDMEQVKKKPKLCSNVDNAEDTAVVVQQKAGQDTAEIQKVMEDLKALQQMTYTSSQHKPTSSIDTPSSTPNQQPLTVTSRHKNSGKTFSLSNDTSFQEAFQRQFVASLQQQQQSGASSSTLSNSQDKSASNPSAHQIRNKTNATPNKNYESSPTGSVKNNSHPSKTQSPKPKKPSQK